MANLIVEFVNTINSGAIPNINNSWDSVINKDIKEYYEKALNKFKMNIKRLKELQDQEDIIRQLYSFKIESMLIFDKLYYINQETFCNQEYMNMYEETKNKLEKEIKTIEDKAITQNSDKCCTFCKDLLKSLYKGVKFFLNQIDKKFFDNFYKNKTVEDYIADFNELFEGYRDKSKGSLKTELLVDFLIEKEKANIEYFIKSMKSEADGKIQKYDRDIITLDEHIQHLEEQSNKQEEIQQSMQRRVIFF